MTNDKDHAPKRSNNILIAVLALIALLLIIAFLKPEPKSVTENNNEEFLDSSPILSLSSETPEEWNGIERAEKNIQSLGKDQVIMPSIVQDPTNEKIVYFASVAYNQTDREPTEALIGIYRYNTEDFTFERLYKETLAYEDFGLSSTLSYHVVAFSEGNLIIAKRGLNSFPPPSECPGFLTTYPVGDDYFLMAIDDPYGGFIPYDVPKTVADEADRIFEQCLNAIGKSYNKQ